MSEPYLERSEYYLERRNALKDLGALLGFFFGFIASAPFGWPQLVRGFETGQIDRGAARFLVIAMVAAVIGAGIGALFGRAMGWFWERHHRRTRKPVIDDRQGAGSSDTAAQLQPSPVRSRATGDFAPPAQRLDYDIDPRAYLDLLERAGRRPAAPEAIPSQLARTMNVAAWRGERLVGVARLISDGASVTALAELIIDPEVSGRGLERDLLNRARDIAPSAILVVDPDPETAAAVLRLGGASSDAAFVLRAKRPQ